MGEGKKLGFGNDMLHDSYKELYNNPNATTVNPSPGAANDSMGGSATATFANRFNKLGVDMVVDDFNGDRIDDIAVLSYFFVNGGRGGHTNKNAYRPQVKIKYGKAGGGSTGGGSSFVDGDADDKFYVCPVGETRPAGVANDNSMNACSITAGDFNNDGYEDILVAGAKARILCPRFRQASLPLYLFLPRDNSIFYLCLFYPIPL